MVDVLDVSIASDVSKKITLQRVSFQRISAEFVTDARPKGPLTFTEKPTVVDWDRSEDQISASFRYGLTVSVLDPEELKRLREDQDTRPVSEVAKSTLAEISISLKTEYREQGDQIDSSALRHFIGIVGFMHVYPYIRAEVQVLIGKLQLPTLTLPVVLSGDVPARVVLQSPASKSKPAAKPHGRSAGGKRKKSQPKKHT